MANFYKVYINVTNLYKQKYIILDLYKFTDDDGVILEVLNLVKVKRNKKLR